MLPALQTLKQHHQWVAWKYEQRKGKQTKVPKNPKTGGNAMPNNRKTWASYEAACEAVNKYHFDGISFVFSTEDDFFGVDLDHCLNPNTGQLDEWAALVVKQMNSYTEISPSGTGLKIFCRGTLPESGRKNGDIEMYQSGKPFTFTGEHWTASPPTIEERTTEAIAVYNQYFKRPEPPRQPAQIQPVTIDDVELINKAKSAKNGAKFSQLWNGDIGNYYSPSEAHLALCNILAFWTGNDGQRIDHLFKQSALYDDCEEKWNTRHNSQGLSYGQMTIAKALQQTTTFYSPPPVNGNGHHVQLPQEAEIDLEEIESDAPGENEYGATYGVENGQMIYTTFKTVGGDIIPHKKFVAPFSAYIEEKLTVFDEQDQHVVYTLKGKKGKIPFTAKVTADDWADPRALVSCILRYLPGKPPDTDPNLRKHWGPAISAITDERQMAEIKAIPSTGWSPDGKAYVMPRGGVGSGYICRLDPGIEVELGHFGLVEQSTEDNRLALAALLSLGRIYRRSVLYTLLAHAFLPPLIKFVGNEARYLYHIHADTGSLKTELAKLIMALYGTTDSQGITYKWTNTPYGAESRAYALKDCLMLIDDLKPGAINEVDKAKWVAFVQAAVDAMGRKRATISGKAAASLPPRALILSTGEAIPEAGEASYTARMILAELNRQPEGRNELLDKIKTVAPKFSGLMFDYIKWLLEGHGQGALEEYREMQSKGLATQHIRLAANAASNRLGAKMLIKFCLARGYLNPPAADIFLQRHWEGLNDIIRQTDDKAHSERYSQRFIYALKDALDTGYCYLGNEIKEHGRRVGWEDDTYLYLLGGAKEIVDQWLRQSGQTPINISKKDLRKQLYDDGLAYSTTTRVDIGKYDYQALDPSNTSRPMVTAIFKESLSRTLSGDQDD